jgi:plastocyanin
MMRNARLTALVVPIILVIAACSGSSTTAPSAPPSSAPSPSASAAPSGAPSGATGDAVSIAGFSFKPGAITVAVGTTVTWTNDDSTGHTVTADDGSFDSRSLAKGATFTQTFTTAGTFAYHCSIHSSMTGTVTVQ